MTLFWSTDVLFRIPNRKNIILYCYFYFGQINLRNRAFGPAVRLPYGKRERNRPHAFCPFAGDRFIIHYSNYRYHPWLAVIDLEEVGQRK